VSSPLVGGCRSLSLLIPLLCRDGIVNNRPV
jgi:hypothetical protein